MPRDFLDLVYRHIALGRYQEAINILNRQIKKQPDFLVLKVWKCEALYGLGNISESEELMSSVEQSPLDKQTIDCIADYYRARGNYTRLVEVYEDALKYCPADETWRKSIFECCGLAGDYKKQHQQALILYKQNPQMLYYCMAVVCLLQQADENPLALELAGRMMLKQHDSGKIKSKTEIFLMIIVFERQNKLQEALLHLEKYSSILDMTSTLEKKMLLLEKLKRWPELIVLLKDNIVNKPDNWMYWQLYLKAVLALHEIGGCADEPNMDDTVEKAQKFLLDIKQKHNNIRGPSLAIIELFKLTKKDVQNDEFCQLLFDYFEQFGTKTICVFDMSMYVPLLDQDSLNKLLRKISSSDYANTPAVELQKKMEASKHISFLQIAKMTGKQTSLTLNQRELLCNDLESCYKAAEGCDRREQYLQLLTLERCQLYKETGDAEHLIRAACLLEDALANSTIFALQVLLLRVYFTMGASKAARKIYDALRIQSVQVDTLVHLFLSTLSSTGHFTLASEMWDTALKILKQCVTESLEALVLCYRAGLFHRVEELTECARRFQHTITVPLLHGEKFFLDIVMGEPSRSEQVLLRTRPLVSWNTCLDNRDLKALPTWDPPSSQKPADQSFAELLMLCKIREATMNCLSNAIALGKQRKETEENNFRSALDRLQALYADALSLPNRDSAQTRLFQIVQNPLPSILEKLLEPDLASTDKVCTMLQKGTESCLELAKLRNSRNLFEAIVTQMELLAVVTVACGASRTGLAPAPVVRRRSDQIVRSLETSWSNIETCLPPSQKINILSSGLSTRENVENKMRESIQAASEELRKIIRKKVSYLHKLVAN